MRTDLAFWARRFLFRAALVPLALLSVVHAGANPSGGTVARGSATFSSSGSQFNINQSSANAVINWQSFNIGAGETVNFNQPSATSVTWNQINDPNPSQILGSLNANGYIILQNSSGFCVGGRASITAHGLILSTASTPALNLSSGGPWSFDAPPPTAKILNYGRINISGGGSAYLIANDIENNGTISAPGGNIGLYAGEKVLVSMSPDGRGLSAQATIPQGMVDNNGKLVADAGNIALDAKMVNQNGVIQANSAQDVNGTIELIAGDSVSLGANSTISAQGDSQGVSSGGSVTVKAGNSYSDQIGSSISVAGGAQGGNGGQVEISAPQMEDINTTIDGEALGGFTGGILTIDPNDVWLDTADNAPAGYTYVALSSFSGMSQISVQADNDITLNALWSLAASSSAATLSLSSGNTITINNNSGISAGKNWTVNLTAGSALDLGVSPVMSADNLNLAFPSINSADGNVNFQALDNITLNSLLTLSDFSSAAALSLTAGNNITVNDGGGIQAGQNWTLNLKAGTAYSGTTAPNSGNDGIYLVGSAFLQTQNGDINLQAANEVQVGWSGTSAGAGVVNGGAGSINTQNGGNINVTAAFGDVNAGSSEYGLDYLSKANAPYIADASLGGISTANGGNVNIQAGGDVISFSATTGVTQNPDTAYVNAGDPDPGTGAFGLAPGNVTINAGGNVYGCFVAMDGVGTINAQNIGTAYNNVALSLATGGWILNARNSIYLQEVRNPNGLFNSTPVSKVNHSPSAANHLFDYDSEASLTLNAANAVYITGFDLPRPDGEVPLLLPPVVNINAGPGGVVLDTPLALDATGQQITDFDPDITLFPSASQSLDIMTTGGGWLSSGNANGTDASLLMSDSGYTQWFVSSSGIQPFSGEDHATMPPGLNNHDPVAINLTGSQLVNGTPVAAGMENIILQTDKATDINVAGDMIGCSFYGENLNAGDVTSINVGGQIYNPGSFTSVILADGFPALPADDTPLAGELPEGSSLGSWFLALALAVDPGNSLLQQSYAGYSQSELDNLFGQNGILVSALEYSGLISDLANNVAYNPNTRTLTAIGPLSSGLMSALENPALTVLRFDANGNPVLDANGHLVTDTIPWVPVNSANASLISTLSTESQGSVALGSPAGAYVVGGTGTFEITANSISLGNSLGILSVGDDDSVSGLNYSFLAPYSSPAANIEVTASYLEMPASTIACLAPGGSVTVKCGGIIPNSPLNDNGVGVSMDLGSQELLPFESDIMSKSDLGLGIYTTGGGDVNVSALGTINIDSSRIATFDGGNIKIESFTGDINAGSGGTVAIPINYYAPNYSGRDPLEYIPANGIVAATLTSAQQLPQGASLFPGNVTVTADGGNIYANLGGISQEAYGETLSSSGNVNPTITLTASGSPALDEGNIVLGSSGVIGVNVVANASGTITGLIISQGNADLTAAQSLTVNVLSGGHVNLSSGGNVSGTIVAIGGVNTSGGASVSANIFSSSVNGGAGTLATSSSASSTSQSAANQTSSENQQQVATNTGDDEKKKKKKDQLRTIGRVTVILAKNKLIQAPITNAVCEFVLSRSRTSPQRLRAIHWQRRLIAL